jgi:hypothetical protein
MAAIYNVIAQGGWGVRSNRWAVEWRSHQTKHSRLRRGSRIFGVERRGVPEDRLEM